MSENKESISPISLIFTVLLATGLGVIVGTLLFDGEKPKNVEAVSTPIQNASKTEKDQTQANLRPAAKENPADSYSSPFMRPQSEAKQIDLPSEEEEKKLYPEMKDEKYKKYIRLTFDRLASYDYEKVQTIPKRIKKYNKKKVYLQGFMLPIEVKKGKVLGFLLMRSQMMCCYGIMPKITEWLVVKMKEPCDYYPDVPLKVYGKITVEEEEKDGMIMSLYRMSGEIVVAPKGIKPMDMSDVE